MQGRGWLLGISGHVALASDGAICCAMVAMGNWFVLYACVCTAILPSWSILDVFLVALLLFLLEADELMHVQTTSGLAFLMLFLACTLLRRGPWQSALSDSMTLHLKPKFGIILLGFGGPQPGCCGRREMFAAARLWAFVAKVLGDDPDQADRVTEVAAHYHHLGGFSDYNPLTFQQRDALQAELTRRGIDAPVTCGFRN